MKSMTVTIFVVVAAIMSAVNADAMAERPRTLRRAITLLDKTIDRSKEYYAAKQARVDSIKSLMVSADSVSMLRLNMAVGDEYRNFDMDSALAYYGTARDMARSRGLASMEARAAFMEASILPVNGRFAAAVRLYESVDTNALSPDDMADYYEAGNRLFFYVSSIGRTSGETKMMLGRGTAAIDSLLRRLAPGSVKHRFYTAERLFLSGDPSMAMAELSEFLDTMSIGHPIFARSASMVAYYYDARPDKSDDALYYRVLAAISDIVTGTRETTALQSVGRTLYDRGDLRHAYVYLTAALDHSIESGARIRIVDAAETLPVISAAMEKERHRERVWLMVLVVVLGVASMVILVLLRKGVRDRRRIAADKERISANSSLKDVYIRQILDLCSEYIDCLEEFNRMAVRKIKARQVDDLYEQIRSGKLMRDQTAKFFEVFDETFRTICPDFADEVNMLLRPSERMAVAPSGRLSTELRILAFMRLGIDDAAKVAKFLGLSVNTVYTYRNKMKNRAVDREKFEDNIRKPSKQPQ